MPASTSLDQPRVNPEFRESERFLVAPLSKGDFEILCLLLTLTADFPLTFQSDAESQ